MHELTFGPRGILQFDNARITHKNFAGTADQFNRAGDRNFSVVIEDEEIANQLKADGWNVKVKPPRVEGEAPFMFLPVKVKFNDFGPRVYLKSGSAVVELTEETVGRLDKIDILCVDLDVRPYDWTLASGKAGRSAYLESIHVTQRIDRFAARYASDEE